MMLLKRNAYRAAQQHHFSDLMALYEQNYIHLRRLVPQFADIQREAVSCISGHLDLHLNILEKCKYTSTFKLSYHFFENSERRNLEPDLRIRIYHDARLAETQTGILHTLFANDFSTIQRKWYLNRFLYKWLSYCLYQGHRLLPYEHYHKTRLTQVSGNYLPPSS